jgi:cyclic pyranopterin phosphate synthase
MAGFNDDELWDFVELGRNSDLVVRFIEYMPFDGNKWSQKKLLPLEKILEKIKERYDFEPVDSDTNRIARYYKIPGFQSKFGVIASMS